MAGRHRPRSRLRRPLVNVITVKNNSISNLMEHKGKRASGEKDRALARWSRPSKEGVVGGGAWFGHETRKVWSRCTRGNSISFKQRRWWNSLNTSTWIVVFFLSFFFSLSFSLAHSTQFSFLEKTLLTRLLPLPRRKRNSKGMRW